MTVLSLAFYLVGDFIIWISQMVSNLGNLLYSLGSKICEWGD